MKILVTAGPTREALDPVRYISNRSSGKMGYAIAEAALAKGHEVCLISGPVALPAPSGVTLVRVTTAADMLTAVKKNLRACDILVMAAAVADWRPKNPAPHKQKKNAGPPRIEWEATTDILQAIAPLKKTKQIFCGFAAETKNLAREARRKLREKKIDLIAANDVSQKNSGFESDHNSLTLFFPNGSKLEIKRATKKQCAKKLFCEIENLARQKKV